MMRSSFTPAQIAEALTFAREEWPGEPISDQAARAASYLDMVGSQNSHTDAQSQVLEYIKRVEGAGQ